MRRHNLDRGKFPLADSRSNFRNRSKNNLVHSQAFEPMCPDSRGQAGCKQAYRLPSSKRLRVGKITGNSTNLERFKSKQISAAAKSLKSLREVAELSVPAGRLPQAGKMMRKAICKVRKVYSYRRAARGSTRAARREGIQHASSATPARNTGTTVKVKISCGRIP